MLQLMRTSFRAITNSDSGDHWVGEWVLLLVADEPLPIGRSRFHLGAPGAARIYLLVKIPISSTHCKLYPLPAAIVRLPFAWMRPEIAAGVFYGISSGLLAFGLSREGYERLLIFLAYPYWACILTAQWAPLIMASAFFPSCCPQPWPSPSLDCQWSSLA